MKKLQQAASKTTEKENEPASFCSNIVQLDKPPRDSSKVRVVLA